MQEENAGPAGSNKRPPLSNRTAQPGSFKTMIELTATLILLIAMFIRTVTGFGSALISIPLLSMLYGAKFAIPFILLYECLIDLMILSRYSLKSGGEIKAAWPILLAGVIGIPLGTYVLIYSSERLLRIAMGLCLITFSILLMRNASLLFKRSLSISAMAGLLGGFLCGSIGMPGPVMAILLSGQGVDKDEFRKLIVIFLTVMDFLTFFYYLWLGLLTREMLLLGFKLLPALAAGFLAGSFAFGRVGEADFRKLALGITLAAGIMQLLSAG